MTALDFALTLIDNSVYMEIDEAVEITANRYNLSVQEENRLFETLHNMC